MESTYRISILNNGTWTAPGPVIYSHPYGRHEPVRIAQNFFLVEAEGHRVLVDPGLDDLGSYASPQLEEEPASLESRSTVDILSDAGVRPDEIDILILTHLHFDHYVNAPLFEKARIIVNRREYEYVLLPENRRYLPRESFPRRVFAWLVDEAWERVVLVEGEGEVLPGLSVIETGGHSPGHQIVTVEIGGETVVIPGDEVYMYANLEEDIPIGYYYSFEKHVRAMDLIRDVGDHVLPAHDPLVVERYPSMRLPDASADASGR